MTIEESLDAVLATMTKAAGRPCSLCTDGFRPGGHALPPPVLEEGNYVFRIPAERCEQCAGTSVVSPKITDTGLTMGMVTSVLRHVLLAREREAFGDMNAALDWGDAYLKKVWAAMTPDDISNSVEVLRDRLSTPDRTPPTMGPSAGALTDEELQTLLSEPAPEGGDRPDE